MKHLVPKLFREQLSFVDGDAGRRARPGDQQIRHDARVVLVPVTLGNFLVSAGPGDGPAAAGQLISVSEVAEFAVEVAAKHHAALVGSLLVLISASVVGPLGAGVFAETVGIGSVDDGIPGEVHHQFAFLVVNRAAGVAHVPVELSVGAKQHRMSGVIVLGRAGVGEQVFLLVRLVVAIFVGEYDDIRRAGDDNLIAENSDPQCRVDVAALPATQSYSIFGGDRRAWRPDAARRSRAPRNRHEPAYRDRVRCPGRG